MAVSQDSSALKSDLINWYTVFNNFIASYGGDIPQLTVPDGSKIRATDVNALYTKTNEFKADEYLKAEPDLWIRGSAVTSGTLIKPAQITDSISRTITNMGVVKCRNNATNYFGANANGNNDCGNKYCGMKVNVSFTNGEHMDVMNSSGTKSNGTKGNTICTSGTKANGNNDYGTKYCGMNSCGRKTCGTAASGAPCYSGVCSSGSKSNGANGHTTKSCGDNSCGTNTCGKYTCGFLEQLGPVPCTSGANSSGSNSNGVNGHTSKSHGNKSNTTIVDLRNANSSKTNN